MSELIKTKSEGSFDMSDVPSWRERDEARIQMEKRGKKVSVFWVNDSKLQIEVGDECELITPEDAIKKYSDNFDVMGELKFLLSSNMQQSIEAIENHDMLEEKEDTIDVELDISDLRLENQRKIDEITKELCLHETENAMDQLKQCVSVHKYIATHNVYDGGIMREKEKYLPDEMVERDLYNAIVRNVGVCSSNSIEMCTLFDRIGVKSKCVGLKSRETGGMHMAVIAELMGEYYYFDPTLERTIFVANRGENARPEELLVCCAGMGSAEYNVYYDPKCMMERDIRKGILSLPSNISKESIPKAIINSGNMK